MATRTQLQAKQVYSKQPLFIASVELFNDRNHNSGGLVSDHVVFTDREINPEIIGDGVITSEKGYGIYKIVRLAYAKVMLKFEASGHHEEGNFWNFCGGDADVLYLRHWLVKLNCPELSDFMKEGREIDGG